MLPPHATTPPLCATPPTDGAPTAVNPLEPDELALLAQERNQYRRLVDAILCTSSHPPAARAELVCIGNAAGADNMVHARPAGGFVLRCDERVLMVDPGAGSLACLAAAGLDPYTLTDVLVSHAHDDHAGNLAPAVSAALRLGLGTPAEVNVVVCPSFIEYDDPAATQAGFMLPAYAWQARVHALHVEPCTTTRFDGERLHSQPQVALAPGLRVSATPARHGPIQATGFRIDTPHGCIGYPADTEYFDGLAEAHRGADVLWLNLNTLGLHAIDDRADTAHGDAAVHGHLGYLGVCRLVDAVRPRSVFVSHLGAQLLDQRQEIEAQLRTRFAPLGIAVHCPASGARYAFPGGLAQPPQEASPAAA